MKIQQVAKREGKDPKALCDEISERFRVGRADRLAFPWGSCLHFRVWQPQRTRVIRTSFVQQIRSMP